MTPLSTTSYFQYTRDFALFILNHKLREASIENLRLSQEAKLPLLELFSHLSADELLGLMQSSLSGFLQQIVDDTVLGKCIEALDNWKADLIPGVPKQKVEISDLVSGYSIRRQVFLHLLPSYTTDCGLVVNIATELEKFYIQLEKYAFQAFVAIQQEALHRKNEFLSSLINNSVDGIAAFDPQMRVLEWNTRLEERNGIKREQILGKCIYEVFPGYEHTEEAQATLQAFEGKKVYLADKPYQIAKGWYDAHIVPFYGHDNKVAGALSIVQDITERKLAEIKLKEHQEELMAANEELQEQKEELATMNEELQENLTQLEEIQQVLNEKQERLLEAQSIAHLGNWEYNTGSNSVYWSDEMKKILGYDMYDSSLTYQSYLERVHPDDQPRVNRMVEACIHTGEPFDDEHRVIRVDVAIRWLHCQGRAVTMHDQSYKLIGTALDITGRKEAELLVLEDRHFIEKVADTSPDVITVYDLEKKLNIYSSKQIYEILGYTPEALEILVQKGVQGLVEVIHPEDLPVILLFLESYKTYTDNEAREMEYRIKDNKGEYRWILDRYNVFKRSPEGLTIQIIGIARDITPRKWAENEQKQLYYQLQETNEELARSEEALKELNNELEYRIEQRTVELVQKNEQLSRINADLDNFIYTASHDLKSPIANIDGLLTVLAKRVHDKLPEQDTAMLGMMRVSIDRFNNTITDLTNIAKVQKDMEEEEIEKVSFVELLKEVKEDISPLMASKKAVIIDNLEVEHIGFAKKNLRSILINLLTNAIKYSAADRTPQIRIETKVANEYILLSIADNGVGIPQSQQQKIFSLFKRLHTDVEGSGIGLYIVKRIIENNGGKIEVESEVGKGTTFNFYLKDKSSKSLPQPENFQFTSAN